MNEKIRSRVLNGEIVDTAKYRYVQKVCSNSEKQWVEIRRIPLADLDTTAAIAGWEVMEVVE